MNVYKVRINHKTESRGFEDVYVAAEDLAGAIVVAGDQYPRSIVVMVRLLGNLCLPRYVVREKSGGGVKK